VVIVWKWLSWKKLLFEEDLVEGNREGEEIMIWRASKIQISIVDHLPCNKCNWVTSSSELSEKVSTLNLFSGKDLKNTGILQR
jgi:hypothetical protein